MITCPNCGRENADTVRLCSFCDHELRASEAINCPSCGRLNAPENRVCPHCGARLRGSAPEPDDTWAQLGAPETPSEGSRAPDLSDLAADDTVQSATLATQPDRPLQQASGSDDIRDFFSDLDDEPAAPAAEADDKPDWFTDSLELPEDATLAADSAPKQAADTLPDWLDEGTTTPADAAPAEALPDWLDEGTTAPAASAPAEALPDWLADDAAPPPRATPPVGGPGPSDEMRDWFSDDLPAEGEEASAAEAAPSDELPDWFGEDFPVSREEDEEAEPSPELGGLFGDDLAADEDEAVATPADDLPDWLSGRVPDQESEAISGAEEVGDLPNWLSGDDFDFEQEEEEAPAAESAAAEHAPDWLASLPELEFDDTQETTETVTPSTGELLDRLVKPDDAPSAEAAQPESDDDEWLAAALEAEPTEEAADIPSPGETEPEMPDWLEASVSAHVAGAGAPEVVSEDWLDEVLGAQPAEETTEETPAFEAEPGEGVAAKTPAFGAAPGEGAPDWLDEALGAEPEEFAAGMEPPSAGITADDGAALFDDDMPDWLRAARAKQTGGLPAILAGLEATESGEAEGPEVEPAEPEPSFETEDLLPDTPADDEMPDWLVAARVKQTSQPPPEPVPMEPPAETEPEPASPPSPDFAAPPAAEGIDDDMPDWLRAMQPGGLESAEGVLPSDDISPFEGSLFDWLDEEQSPEEQAVTTTQEDVEFPITEPVDLESADLPEWLEALRPEEAPETPTRAAPVPVAPVAPGSVPAEMEMLRAANIPGVLDPEANTREESVGPLKGVMGVVAASPVFTTLQRSAAPRTASPALTVDSAQISLLEAVLRPREDVTSRVIRPLSVTIARVLVTLLMIAAVALPIVGGFAPFNPPDAIEAPAADAARSMVNLGPSPNVLLAFEYDPSQAGELNVEAEILVSYLMARDATLYAVSTQPTGPALAQALLEDVAEQNGYVYGEGYLNLGYVSGDATGVRGLITGVTEGTVSPLAFDYQGTPTDSDQTRLADLEIDMIVLLAGTPEAVRVWVEQAANPSAIPMVAAVGAGVEPMALPYYHQGRQLEGVVSGLAGATRFARATQGPILPQTLNTRWNAQVAGALAAGLAILIGVIAKIVPTEAARPQQEGP